MSYNTLFLAKSFDLLFEYFQIGHTFQISYASGIDYSDSLDIIQNDAKPMLYNVDDGNITLPLARPYENLLSFDVGPTFCSETNSGDEVTLYGIEPSPKSTKHTVE
jgi:hypothetical protein